MSWVSSDVSWFLSCCLCGLLSGVLLERSNETQDFSTHVSRSKSPRVFPPCTICLPRILGPLHLCRPSIVAYWLSPRGHRSMRYLYELILEISLEEQTSAEKLKIEPDKVKRIKNAKVEHFSLKINMFYSTGVVWHPGKHQAHHYWLRFVNYSTVYYQIKLWEAALHADSPRKIISWISRIWGEGGFVNGLRLSVITMRVRCHIWRCSVHLRLKETDIRNPSVNHWEDYDLLYSFYCFAPRTWQH